MCWIANDTSLLRANCFPTDRVISNWNRCSHIHWPIYLLHWNMDQAKDGQESTFLHDNASSHKCAVVKYFLASEKVKVLNHPPYSPNLSLCDFFHFQGLRKCFLKISIRLEVLLAALFISVSNRYQKKAILSTFRDWVKRLQKCVSVKGGYFEGL